MQRIIIYSGGMDSFTLLHRLIALYGTRGLTALSFNYGQRHKKELEYALAECDRLGLPHRIVDLSSVGGLLGGSSLTDPSIPVPEGHYEAASMKATVVPGRNAIMLAIAAGFAEALGQRFPQPPDRAYSPGAIVYFGAHSGDHHIYPDCRPAFVEAFNQMARLSSEGLVEVRAPYLHLNKLGILRDGASIGLTAADYARAWTCYKGGAQPCGVCGSCQERAEAFCEMGWVDPPAAY